MTWTLGFGFWLECNVSDTSKRWIPMRLMSPLACDGFFFFGFGLGFILGGGGGVLLYEMHTTHEPGTIVMDGWGKERMERNDLPYEIPLNIFNAAVFLSLGIYLCFLPLN